MQTTFLGWPSVILTLPNPTIIYPQSQDKNWSNCQKLEPEVAFKKLWKDEETSLKLKTNWTKASSHGPLSVTKGANAYVLKEAVVSEFPWKKGLLQQTVCFGFLCVEELHILEFIARKKQAKCLIAHNAGRERSQTWQGITKMPKSSEKEKRERERRWKGRQVREEQRDKERRSEWENVIKRQWVYNQMSNRQEVLLWDDAHCRMHSHPLQVCK